MRAQFTLSADVHQSARVMQMAGMMDVPLDEKTSESWDVDVPIEERDWSVGLVVGPSGSGKSSLARQLWPDALMTTPGWSPDRSILDDFPESMSVRDIVKLLNAVGLGSVPAWLRPRHTLSTGEGFRADIARTLAETEGLVVVDEFTSVVDRQVAQVGSHSVQKAIRRSGRQFVAVTCHYDVTDWLQPDWVVDMAGGTFSWRSVQPHPPVELRVHPVDHSAWRVFARHHYLSGQLHKAARCFGGFVGDECVAFTSYLHYPHPRTKTIKMGHRLVVLPDWQGLGIGGRLDDWLGQHLYEQGLRYRNTVAHPAMIAYYARSPRWRDVTGGRKELTTTSKNKALRKRALSARSLGTRSYEYAPLPRGQMPV